MASNFETFCDAVLDELTLNVPALRDALKHRLVPWDPEVLLADAGEKHLAVYPAAEAADTAEPLVTGPGGDLLVQLYRVLYWEDAGDEASRGVADEPAAAAMYETLEACRARFYAVANLRLGGTELTRYVGTSLPERSSSVRWFQITLQARTSILAS